MVTPAPPTVIGLNLEEFVYAKVVVPANVTTDPAFKLAKLILLFVGTLMSCNVISVQAATAGAIWEYAVHVHGVDVEVVEEELLRTLDEVAEDGLARIQLCMWLTYQMCLYYWMLAVQLKIYQKEFQKSFSQNIQIELELFELN